MRNKQDINNNILQRLSNLAVLCGWNSCLHDFLILAHCCHGNKFKMEMHHANTVKFLDFRTPNIFAVSYLKLKQRGQTLGYFVIMVQKK